MQKYEQVYRNWKRMTWDNFLGGIAWGLGATIGLAIVVGVLTFVLKQVNVVPVIGNFASQVNTYIQHPKK
ncbi:MAG TPA: DUF5665 domain-containing protein [Candidatus Saccharimonadales bacterium]|nr:DUF5665 domain-containing protein [Candidatus Saccharimonadales bacterium]